MDNKIALEIINIEKEYAVAMGRNLDTWYMYYNHILGVAELAKKIAQKSDDLNPQKAYLMGLLHDIGKLKEQHLQRHHGVIGYEILKDIDEDIARVCLTHMFYYNKKPKFDKTFFNNQDDYDFVCEYLEKSSINEYDKLIQCADGFADKRGLVTLEQRAEDFEKRHNMKVPSKALEGVISLKSYFEGKINQDIYSLFDEINIEKKLIKAKQRE